MNEALKTAVQLQSDRLRSKAQAHNEDFINEIDENMKKIIKEQVKTSLTTMEDTVTFKIERSRYEMKMKNLPLDPNRGPRRKDLENTVNSTSAPKEKTSKSSGKYKEGFKSHHTSTDMSAQAEEPIHADEDLEEPAH
ncbi:hypothetical protein Tco_0493769 [Tanacetum coccineum]